MEWEPGTTARPEKECHAMSPIPGNAIEVLPTHRSDLVVHESGDEAVVYDPLTAATHRLNSTALEIWKQCDGSHRAADIAARLTDLFEVSMVESQKHVDRMISELQSLQMLVSDEAALSYLPFEST
jgi:PqqD family protein of HPr-rel-A system